MRNQIALLALAAALAGCSTAQGGGDSSALRGLESVNVPVVSRADYSFDASAPDGSLAPGEAGRLDAWFNGLDLGYGDNVYVDGNYSDAARRDIAVVAGRYGILVSNGAPVTANAVAPGSVRVVVSRTRATVPGCPNWREPAQPNMGNHTMSNFGCAVNGNLAAMIANPEDLVHGRAGGSVVDAASAAKAVDSYRKAEPSGNKGLKDITTKGN